MAHTFDTKNRSASASTNPVTLNHTCAPNATLLVLSITTTGAPAVARTGGAPTCNTLTMLQAGTSQVAAASPEETKELWYCLAPVTGVPLTITVPNTGATAIILETYSFISSLGASVFDAAGGGNGTSTNPSANITTVAANALVVSTVGSGAQTWAPSARTIGGSAGTLLNDVDDGNFGNGSQYILSAGAAGSKACAWTFGTSEDWAICSASFTEAAGPTTFVKPTLVSSASSAYNAITTPKTVSTTYLAGDIILVEQLCETNIAPGAPTLTGVVFGLVKSNAAASTCSSAVYAGIATSGGTANVSMTNASGLNWGYTVKVFRLSAGIGFSSEQHTTTPTVALIPDQTHSAISWTVGDFSAGAVQSPSPSSGVTTRQNTQIAGRYTFYDFDLADQVSGASVSYGLGGGAGAVSIIVTEIKGLASSGAMTATIAGAATASLALTGTGALSETSAGASTVSATLAGNGALSSTINGIGSVSATLISLGQTATCTGASTLNGTLTGLATLAGTIAGIGSVTAALVGTGSLASTIPGTASATLTLAGKGTLSSTINGTASGSAALIGSGILSSTIAGIASSTLSLVGKTSLASTINGASTTSFTLVGSGALAATIAGTASVSATISGGSTASTCTIAGAGTFAGTLVGKTALTSTAAGLASVSASLSGTAILSATVPGSSTVSGTITAVGALIAVVAGVSTTTYSIRGTAQLACSLVGSSTVNGLLFGNAAALATLNGVSSLIATLIGSGTRVLDIEASVAVLRTIGISAELARSIAYNVDSLRSLQALSTALRTLNAEVEL